MPKPVKIFGKRYSSNRIAAAALGVSESALHQWVSSGDADRCAKSYFKKKENDRIRGIARKNKDRTYTSLFVCPHDGTYEKLAPISMGNRCVECNKQFARKNNKTQKRIKYMKRYNARYRLTPKGKKILKRANRKWYEKLTKGN